MQMQGKGRVAPGLGGIMKPSLSSCFWLTTVSMVPKQEILGLSAGCDGMRLCRGTFWLVPAASQ